MKLIIDIPEQMYLNAKADTLCGADILVKAIKNGIPLDEQEPKWIPVSERLPEKEGLYFVSVKNDHQRRYSKTCYFSRKNWFVRQDIIAWMPLPKPYEPHESEEV